MIITFIEGHAKKNGDRVLISVPHITVVVPVDNYVRIYTDDHSYTDVTDDYEEVVKGIEKMCSVMEGNI